MPHEASFQHPGDPATRAASEAPRVGRLRQRALSRPLFELPRRARAPRVLARRLPARRLPPPRCGPSARQWCSRATPLRWRRSSVLRKPRQPPPALPTTRSSNSPGISPIQRLARRWPSPAQPATSGLAPQPACIPSRLSPRLHGRYPALRSTAACAPVTPSSDRSIASVTLVEPGEDLVRLVDDDKVERRTGGKRFRSAFTPGELTADQIDPRGGEVRVILARLDAEQVQQLVLPLSNQGLGDNEQDALRAFGAALGDDETGLDGLAQPDFVGEDAPSLAETSKREDDGVDLVRIRIDPATRGVSFCMETAFADPRGAKVDFVKECRSNGYTVVLVFIGLESADLSCGRRRDSHARLPICTSTHLCRSSVPLRQQFGRSALSFVAEFRNGRRRRRKGYRPAWTGFLEA